MEQGTHNNQTKYMEEKLIELVREYPLLYDGTHRMVPLRLHQEARRQAWKEISQRLNTTSHVIRKKWQKLRQTHSYVLRRKRLNQNELKWRFEDKMLFLLNAESRTTDNDEVVDETPRTNENSEDVSEMNLKVPPLEPAVPPASLVEPPPTVTIPYHNPSPINVENRKRRQMGVMKECMRQNYANDETEMLFLSLSRSVKKLPPTEQIKVKSEIVNIVFQAEFNHAQSIKQSDSVQSSLSDEV